MQRGNAWLIMFVRGGINFAHFIQIKLTFTSILWQQLNHNICDRHGFPVSRYLPVFIPIAVRFKRASQLLDRVMTSNPCPQSH
jgi:hypothetical protein